MKKIKICGLILKTGNPTTKVIELEKNDEKNQYCMVFVKETEL